MSLQYHRNVLSVAAGQIITCHSSTIVMFILLLLPAISFPVAMNGERFPEEIPFRLTRMLIKAREDCFEYIVPAVS
jgi:hypothetical protein